MYAVTKQIKDLNTGNTGNGRQIYYYKQRQAGSLYLWLTTYRYRKTSAYLWYQPSQILQVYLAFSSLANAPIATLPMHWKASKERIILRNRNDKIACANENLWEEWFQFSSNLIFYSWTIHYKFLWISLGRYSESSVTRYWTSMYLKCFQKLPK